ncbi:molybdate ABC transporter substrate-binding protein [Paenibacillus gansuensis]|uniref:Molybdate ABC transporter substrate-binding protein n=1 Tax=Paenibacillus gansuensis TaxID=306542 RepID=A0ABW5PIA4_9BACL
MRKRIIWFLALAVGITAGAVFVQYTQKASTAETQTELLVSAAASLKDSLTDIEGMYEKEHPGIQLQFNYGPSGTLQKQIEQGAPADLFFSAGTKQMDTLRKQGLIRESTDMLLNELVLITPRDSKLAFATVKELTRPDVRTIALGQPESVPAGQYAKETLTALKTWDVLKDKFVYAKDVRQVLTYVETGNADAGFVYKTDAMTSSKVKIAIRVNPGIHAPIIYPAGIVKQTKHPKEADDFYTYLQSEQARGVFSKYGFQLP